MRQHQYADTHWISPPLWLMDERERGAGLFDFRGAVVGPVAGEVAGPVAVVPPLDFAADDVADQVAPVGGDDDVVVDESAVGLVAVLVFEEEFAPLLADFGLAAVEFVPAFEAEEPVAVPDVAVGPFDAAVGERTGEVVPVLGDDGGRVEEVAVGGAASCVDDLKIVHEKKTDSLRD